MKVASWAAAGAAGWALRARARRGLELTDRVVLVTGGSRGLGLVLARRLLEEGARVALCGRDPLTLARAEAQLGSSQRVLAVPCDVGNAAEVGELIARIVSRWGRLDAVINNAGALQVGPFEEMSLEDFEADLRVHFWGPLHVTLAALPHLRHAGDGRLVNIVSVGGKVAVPHLLPYSASKFALAGLSEGLRAELSPHRVKVTTVFPGLMRTGSPRNVTFRGQHRAEYAWFKTFDSLPGLSMSAERAARRIVQALRDGEPQVVLSVPAKLAAIAHGLFPSAVSRVMTWMNSALPRPGGLGRGGALGSQSESGASESWFNVLTDQAAARNNEALH